MAATAKVIHLKGNPREPESAEHIIKFPGGSISVCRTSDNQYWAHIEVNHEGIIDDAFRESKIGKIEATRLEYFRPPGEIKELQDTDDLTHIAVKIKTGKEL